MPLVNELHHFSRFSECLIQPEKNRLQEYELNISDSSMNLDRASYRQQSHGLIAHNLMMYVAAFVDVSLNLQSAEAGAVETYFALCGVQLTPRRCAPLLVCDRCVK